MKSHQMDPAIVNGQCAILCTWCLLLVFTASAVCAETPRDRLRLAIETDAGGDPDDEQSLVRFLLYTNEWDVEAIIANRAKARDGENLNPERTGLGIVQRLINAYGECYPNLVKHDPRYPTPQFLLSRTVAGYDNTDEAVQRLIAAIDRDDPRPLWYSDWGTDSGGAKNNLRRALDRVLSERGEAGYAKFKNRIRLSSADPFGEHTYERPPAFSFWVDTFRPELDRKRWYHRFSALTATAGGFDLRRDVLTGHGPLGALYPTNTTHPQKEGDSGTFIYLVPTGMNDPEQPTWGSWAGRYGPRDNAGNRSYYWANVQDQWQGTKHRENSLKRWAEHLQNDFRARLNWCVTDFAQANHPPVPRVRGELQRRVHAGEKIVLDARESTDPDGDALQFEWVYYPEPGSYRGPAPKIEGADQAQAALIVPEVESVQSIHVILVATDDGSPALTRYQRVIITVE